MRFSDGHALTFQQIYAGEAMIVAHDKDTERNPISHPDAQNAKMQVLVGPQQGWADHVMRMIELAPEGFTPRHTHDWPHINYMVEGDGILHMDGKDTPVSAGSYAYVPAGTVHQFKNTGAGKFRFICIVPKEGHQ